MISKRILIITSILILNFVACKQQEKIAKQKFQQIKTEEEIEKLIFNGNNEIKSIKLTKVNFKIDVNNETYISGGNIAILKDSLIIISIIPLMGYEITRIYCLKEKILVINRQDKTYFYSKYERNIGQYYLKGDYNKIESILTGRAFIYEGKKQPKDLKKNILRNEGLIKYYLELKDNDFIISRQEITIREDNLLTERNDISDHKNHFELKLDYGQYETINYYVLPREIKINANNTNNQINVHLNISNIIINDKINAEIIIPEKYDEIIME